MSKRDLKKYLRELPRPALEEQLLDLYVRFPEVKTYYDFIFNPKEDKLVQEAKTKIGNEYFPVKRRKPKARRSVAHKFIKHFLKLGVEPVLLADVMLYNIEIAQLFAKEKNVNEAFYKSMLKSFEESLHFISINALLPDFKERILKIYQETQESNWPFAEGFSRALDVIDY
ncbi:MAG: hypothetical protein CML05_08170 [Pseudozobellia sp.]|nr:hypothetical protein [Pseudozobellia sp.]|tara:strand:- start:7302 stop:7814 length:513 start_codon:yes stop_codon:yes gene_type:complete